MYHTRFCGTHYDIGHRYGSVLRKNGKFILEQVPWPIGTAQISFAAACRPYYEQYFPKILDEIRGLADGQGCPAARLETVLFCMYCMVPSCHCSHFAVRNQRTVLFGRNSDFLTCIEKLYTNNIYHFTDGAYAFNGNTTAFLEMEDGVNEHGLAAGLTMVPARTVRPGMNAGMVLRMILETCTNVPDAKKLLEKLPLASGQTFVLADREGRIALIECGPSGMEFQIPDGPEAFVCATNRFHLKSMIGCNGEDVDDWQAEERYQTLLHTLRAGYAAFTLEDAKDLLSGRNGFICQYDRKTGKDTVWSVLYEAGSGRLWRAEGNPSRRSYREDTRFPECARARSESADHPSSL